MEGDPSRVLAPYVREGMIVLEPGPGMGYFTLELARRVGPAGRVVAVDIQRRMLDGLKRRAAKAGLLERVDARLALPDSMGLADLSGAADFALAYAMVHEIPAPGPFFAEVSQALKPGGRVLLVEPAGHVDSAKFESELSLAAEAGLNVTDRPAIRRNHAAVLTKAANS
jgi:SAM-dependent methyltransferase